MTSDNNKDEVSDARAVSNDNERVETTGEAGAVSNDGAGAAPTVATIAEAVSGVEIIDVDALSNDDGTSEATNATVKDEKVVEGEGVCGGGSIKKDSNDKTAADVLTALIAKTLSDVRGPRRPVSAAVVPEVPLPDPERTAAMWRDHNSNRSNTATRYIPGDEHFPGQVQLHNFGRPKSVA